MPRICLAIGVLVAAALNAACFNASTVVYIKPDGSGTVEQTLTMNPQMLQQLAGMMGAMGEDTAADGPKFPGSSKEILSEAEAKELATKMGEGVRFVSRTPISRPDAEGAKVVFAFDDIRKVAVNEATAPGKSSNREAPIQFSFDKGMTASTLTVTFPERTPDADGAGRDTPTEAPPPEQLAMLQQFFKGFHVEVGVEVVGTLVSTTSPYVAGNRVTLVEMDFDDLLANPAALQKLNGLGPGMSVAEARGMLQGVKGVK